MARRIALALCLVGLVATTHAGTQEIEGHILGVHDGDTITLLDLDNRQHKIRLDGIDAPELGQPFGRASKQHLAELLANREAVAECSKIDRYRREVSRLLAGGDKPKGMHWRTFERLQAEHDAHVAQSLAGIAATLGMLRDMGDDPADRLSGIPGL